MLAEAGLTDKEEHNDDNEATNLLAGFCKAAADPHRLGILRVLRNESYGVQELTYIFDMLQSGMSHHLKILAKAGLVTTRKEGTRIFYRQSLVEEQDPHRHLKQALFTCIESLPLSAQTKKRKTDVREERARLSQAYFSKNADRFSEKQDLIVTYNQYEGCVNDLLASIAFSKQTSVLEVGPGNGELLFNLAARFGQITALDNSEEMLAKTRQTMEAKGLGHINYISGDTAVARASGTKVDLVALNMVLHHMASPAQALADCAQLLAIDGVMLVADLGPHGQNWVRESCGDLWLGFDAEELGAWAQSAGLHVGQSIFISLKNGFQVQMRLFHAKT